MPLINLPPKANYQYIKIMTCALKSRLACHCEEFYDEAIPFIQNRLPRRQNGLAMT
jgi:hypothetical protein